MDALIAAAARALAAGDPLGALKRVALRDDAPALALRGIAMAQLGEFTRAKALLRGAARAFGPKEVLARARCVLAEAEIALVSRNLGWPGKALAAAGMTLKAHGDQLNAMHARYLEIRWLLLLGRIGDAERMLGELDPRSSPVFTTIHELVFAGIAVRRLQAKLARTALTRAERSARSAGIPALAAEVESAFAALNAPAARLITEGERRFVQLEEVEALLASKVLVIDACRFAVRDSSTAVSLATRPVLFTIARALGEAWPADVSRDALVANAFRGIRADESHRARLRVEIARLRTSIRPVADITATRKGFKLTPRVSRQVLVLASLVEDENAAVLAFLSDGESWSSSALALAMGSSQRTVQRALDSLASAGKVQSLGRARSRRWMTPPVAGFTTTLLLPAPLLSG